MGVSVGTLQIYRNGSEFFPDTEEKLARTCKLKRTEHKCAGPLR